MKEVHVHFNLLANKAELMDSVEHMELCRIQGKISLKMRE